VRADVGQLEQVLLNLAVNGRDAMPEGGKLTFRTSNATLTETHISPFTRIPPGNYAVLTVSDTGVGIAPETLKRVFEPFFTTKRVGEGTGLGLAMVYGIVQQSAGYIEIHSEPGQGASFEIYLPGAAREPVAAHASATGLNPAPKSSATILLVEDDDAVRLVAARILKAHGQDVVECATPSAALKAAKAGPTKFDVFLLDVTLPEISGIALARQLLQHTPGAAVLFMSGYPGQSVIDESVLGSPVGFLEKPFTSQSLTEAVDAVTNAQRLTALYT
jgi:CheY-like chemotaxis protein